MIRLSLAALIFIAVSTVIGFGLGLLWGELQAWMPAFCFVPGLFAAWLAYSRLASSVSEPGKPSWPSWIERLILLFFTVFFLRLFLYYFYVQDGTFYTLNNLYLSLPETLSRIHFFANSRGFWPDHPSLMHSVLMDFGMDLFSALFVLTRISLTSFLPVSGIVIGLIGGAALYRWSKGLGLGAFLFLGGTAAWSALLGRPGEIGYSELYRDSVWYGMLGMMQFLADRGFQFALPAGLFVLWSWRQRFIFKNQGFPFWIEMVLWLSMAIFHFSSFLLVTILGIFWSLCARDWRYAGMLLPSSLLISFAMMGGDWENFHVFNVWRNPQETFWMNFLRRYGYAAAGGLLILAALIRNKSFRILSLFLPAILFFGIFLFFQGSAWKFDQNKTLLVWCFLLAMPAFEEVLSKVSPPRLKEVWIALLFLPGIFTQIDAMKWFYTPAPIIEAGKLDAVSKTLERLPKGYRYLTELEIFHPVALSGFPTVTSFNDYLFLPGSREISLAADARRLLSGGNEWRKVARQRDARFLFWGEREKKNYQPFSPSWQGSAKKVHESSWGSVYDLGVLKDFENSSTAEGVLTAKLYANAEWSGEALAEFEVGQVDFSWDDTRADVLSPPWSMLFEGSLYIPESGETTFYLMSDDGGRLEINEAEVIENHGPHGRRIASGKRSFETGWYPIRVYHYDLFGGAMIRLWWKRPSGVEEMIPSEYFRPAKSGETSK